MADWRSKYVSQLGWHIKTRSEPGSGTDSRVTVIIIRDDDHIIALNVEPGETERLDRGNSIFHSWKFTGAIFVPSNYVTWAAGLGYPDAVEFPDDIQGHLKCRFEIHGDDMWRKDEIIGYVRYTRPQHVSGTIDSQIWVDDLNWTHAGNFTQDKNLSTDSSEGFQCLTLIY
jgi:hypothetical protein